MNTGQEVMVKPQNQQIGLTQDDIKTLVSANVIPANAPKSIVEMFARYCSESGLSPFKRQVHLVARGGKYNIQTGIDGYRSIADRTKVYAGNDDYSFDEGLTEYQMIDKKRNRPTTATATVYKIVSGVRCPFSATARWEEYYPGDSQGFMWKKMPFLMLGKCAESLALRKAFPDEIGGIYTDEEMGQAGGGASLPLSEPEKRATEPENGLKSDSSVMSQTSETAGKVIDVTPEVKKQEISKEQLEEIQDKMELANSLTELTIIASQLADFTLTAEQSVHAKGIFNAMRMKFKEAGK